MANIIDNPDCLDVEPPEAEVSEAALEAIATLLIDSMEDQPEDAA